MRLTTILSSAKRFYVDLDYARHMPKSYVDRVKRIIPKKVYDNRFGAPKVIRWVRPPDDYIPSEFRPWEGKALRNSLDREKDYESKQYAQRFFRKNLNRIQKIPDEEWTFFPGDIVQVMVGKDKGKQGVISRVVRDFNAVFVDGLHLELKNVANNKEMEDLLKQKEMEDVFQWESKALFVDKGQVMLVDPHDNEPCTARWILNDSKTEYIRASEKTGYRIPLPSQAYMTYEYVAAKDYLEVEAKDTPAKVALEKTYEPKLSTFEDELMEYYNIKDTRKPKPTYWY